MANISNCLPCLLRTNYNPLKRVYPVQGYCKHSKSHFSSKTEFRLILRLVIVNVPGIVFLIFPLASYLWKIQDICHQDKSLCLIFIADILYLITCIILSLSLIGLLHVQKREFNCWSYLLENPQRYNLESILSDKVRRKFKLENGVMFAMILFANCVLGVLYYYFPYDRQNGSLLRDFTIVWCYTFQCYGTLEIFQRINVIHIVLQAFEASLHNNFPNRPNFFRNYCQLIHFVNFNISLLMKYFHILLQFWSVNSSISLILNIYVLIEFYDYNLLTLSTLETRTLLTIFAIVGLLVTAEERLNRKADDILSFLFKYPISKLSAVEATQVEVLISTLTIQKPVLRASNNFIVGARLLASISGTVVTYVLVALQFRASWTK